MLLEHRRGKQGRFEAMRGVMPDDPAEAAQRGASGRWLRVVGERVQVPLHIQRRPQPPDEAPLGGCEMQWLALYSSRSSSATSSCGVQSAPE